MVSLGKSEGKVSQFVSGVYQRADTYLSGYELDNETKQGSYRAVYQGEKNSTVFGAGYMNKAFGAQGFYGPAADRANEDGSQWQTYLTHEHRINSQKKLDFALNYHQHEDSFQYLTSLASEHETKAFQGRLRWHANQHLALGYEFNEEKVDSNKLQLGNKHNRNFDSAFAYGHYDLNVIQVAASLSYLTYKDGDSYTLPVLGVVLPLGQQQLYANAGRSVRVPTMNDLFMNKNPDMGNPDVKPEETDSYEFGARLNLGCPCL